MDTEHNKFHCLTVYMCHIPTADMVNTAREVCRYRSLLLRTFCVMLFNDMREGGGWEGGMLTAAAFRLSAFG